MLRDPQFTSSRPNEHYHNAALLSLQNIVTSFPSTALFLPQTNPENTSAPTTKQEINYLQTLQRQGRVPNSNPLQPGNLK